MRVGHARPASWPDERPVRPIARLAALAALAALAVGAAPAAAHPLGNFTVNAYSGLRVGPDRLVVDYVVDLAEIPAFQARKTIDADHDDRVGGAEATSWREQACPRLAGLRATVDGQPVPLAVTGSALTFPEGVGGLATLRLECALAGPVPPGPSSGRSLTYTYTDANQQGRVGWREITAVGDRATSTPPTFPRPAPAPASPPTHPTSSPPPSTSAPPPSASTRAGPPPLKPPVRPHPPPDRQARTRPPGARPPGGGA